MNALMLSNSIFQVNLPPELGGGVANYNYMFSLNNLVRPNEYMVPANLANKEVLVVGEVWSANNMNNKTSANSIALTWNNYSNSHTLHGASRWYEANRKIPIKLKIKFTAINSNKIRFSSYQTGSHNAQAGWNTSDCSLQCRGNLTFYYN
ncbi:hypothetical protein ACLMND_000871 [Campylobacter lari]|uniref:Uncharacterized protein n=1 Tax=Campylobacter lari TaxID=201 RepID=A0A6N6BAZ7_CAMLA|nr:hypothetical protein [Campylobacter lari]EAJ0335871.1 hypothetical protein [Campylobacter lari]EAJ0338840.1 hypothetical protein [Campylobacter lari]EDP6814214.1 hypothetical protein [Campylobacter lari]MBT0817935.1 hypothetical protein [Campylobacter lari]MCW0188365.1 hypothetical protein [Campylobacter lari]